MKTFKSLLKILFSIRLLLSMLVAISSFSQGYAGQTEAMHDMDQHSFHSESMEMSANTMSFIDQSIPSETDHEMAEACATHCTSTIPLLISQNPTLLVSPNKSEFGLLPTDAVLSAATGIEIQPPRLL